MERRGLGILQLADAKPVDYGGAVSDPTQHPYPIVPIRVPGSTSERVFDDDPEVITAYIHAAQDLERLGIAAITSNCGFTARFQPEVAAAVRVPVGLSSLLMVPLAARLAPPYSRIAVLTFDANRLSNRHFRGAGWSTEDIPVVIAGIEGSQVWQELQSSAPKLDRNKVSETVADVAERVVKTHSDVRAIVLECSVFPMAAEAVRLRVGLPTFDFITLSHILMTGVGGMPECSVLDSRDDRSALC